MGACWCTSLTVAVVMSWCVLGPGGAARGGLGLWGLMISGRADERSSTASVFARVRWRCFPRLLLLRRCPNGWRCFHIHFWLWPSVSSRLLPTPHAGADALIYRRQGTAPAGMQTPRLVIRIAFQVCVRGVGQADDGGGSGGVGGGKEIRWTANHTPEKGQSVQLLVYLRRGDGCMQSKNMVCPNFAHLGLCRSFVYNRHLSFANRLFTRTVH